MSTTVEACSKSNGPKVIPIRTYIPNHLQTCKALQGWPAKKGTHQILVMANVGPWCGDWDCIDH